MHKPLLIASVLIASAVLVLPAGGADITKVGENLVEVSINGSGMDKDDAVRDAMRNAVEKGAGTFIYSQSQTRDFVLIKDTVLARSAGFIQSHEVIWGKYMDDGTCSVRIKAIVSIKGVEDTWGVVTTFLKQMGRPKIMVFIREKIDRSLVEDSTVQTRIENLLLKSGFLLVRKEQLKEIDKKDAAAAVASDNPAKLQAIAKRFGAQLFISGVANATAGVKKDIRGVIIYTYQSEANVRCYRSDTAQLLSSIPGSSTRGADRVWRSAANKSLDAQAKRIAPAVRADILQFWQDVLSGRGEIQLHVEGVTFKQYTALKKALKQIKQVTDVTARFSNNVAECSLQADVNAEILAEKIVDRISNLEITDVSQNVIKAKYNE